MRAALLPARRHLLQLAAAGMLAPTFGPVGAAPASPAGFPRTLEAGDTTLRLHGAGTRYRFAFKVYDLALYTTRKVSTPAELLALPGPKRLEFVARRDISSTELGRLFVKGMAENATPEQMHRHTAATSRLIDIFSGKPRLAPGDEFGMTYLPGKGTTFFFAGKPQGAPLGNDEFFGMVLRIWFGDAPADRLLRDALLDRGRGGGDTMMASDNP